MTRIDSLTPEQVSKLAHYRQKWLDIGLATGPHDEAAVLAGIHSAYAAANLPAPKIVVRLGSPMAGAWGSSFLKNGFKDLPGDQVGAQVWDQVGAQVGDKVRDQVRDKVRAQVWDQVGAQVWAQVWDQVGAQVRDQVGDQVGAQVWDQVGAQVWAQVWDQVGAQVRAQVRDQVGAQVRAQAWAACYGSHDANWFGFYDFFRSETGLTVCDKLLGLNAAASGGWFWPFANAVVVTPRPSELHRDSQGRLHNEEGMAIKYPDGWGFYCIHGTGVPGWIITNPEQITAAKIDAEHNAEIRRCMIERMGTGEYLHQTGAKVVAADVFQGMPRALLRDKHGNQYLYGSDGSTSRIYAMPVDPNTKTCRTAHESISGIKEEKCLRGS